MGNSKSKRYNATAKLKQLPPSMETRNSKAKANTNVQNYDPDNEPARSCDKEQCKPPAKYSAVRKAADEEYEMLVETLNANGSLWEDIDFPAIRKVIGNASVPPDFVWKRPKEISSNAKLFVDGTTRFDINQGSLGNCWFLAALADATRNKCLIRHIVPLQVDIQDKRYCGVFRAFFWRFGEWKQVLVDDRLPVTNNNELIFMRSTAKNEMWTALLEKAYAKLYGTYAYLEGGLILEAMEDLTGGLGEIISLDKNISTEELGKKMLWCQERSCLMGSGPLQWNRNWNVDDGLVDGHAYSITGTVKIKFRNSTVILVRLRNPWGNSIEWTGDWSDKSKNWRSIDTNTKRKLNFYAKEDGEFWMSLEDFVKSFLFVNVCHLTFETLLMDKTMKEKLSFRETVLKGQWTKATDGYDPENFETFVNNPQFIIQFKVDNDYSSKKKSVMYIALMQNASNRVNCRIGFCLFKIKKAPALTLSQKELRNSCNIVLKSDANAIREVVASTYLPSGQYLLIPYTQRRVDKLEFLVRIYSEAKLLSE